MKIIISPAKTMNEDNETYTERGKPVFLEDARTIMKEIRKMDYDGMKALWKCNDSIAELNFHRFREMDLDRRLTPAIFSYEGLQYRNMGPMVLSEKALDYIEDHLRILSGFYGVLRPFDGITPYRLEMQAKLSLGGHSDLYGFWGDRIYRSIAAEEGDDPTIINLASKEYSKTIERYVPEGLRFITVDFGHLKDGKVKQKATLAKMARGDMVRFMAENGINDVDDIKGYGGFGFAYSEERSSGSRIVFVKEDEG